MSDRSSSLLVKSMSGLAVARQTFRQLMRVVMDNTLVTITEDEDCCDIQLETIDKVIR